MQTVGTDHWSRADAYMSMFIGVMLCNEAITRSIGSLRLLSGNLEEENRPANQTSQAGMQCVGCIVDRPGPDADSQQFHVCLGSRCFFSQLSVPTS